MTRTNQTRLSSTAAAAGRSKNSSRPAAHSSSHPTTGRASAPVPTSPRCSSRSPTSTPLSYSPTAPDATSRSGALRDMSWATGRNTTPSEDREYALMGIFDVNIPILYGEGNERTFRRLHIEIIQRSYDTIIFAWGLRIALGLTRDSGCVAEGRVERWKYEHLDRLPLVKLTSTLGTGMVDKPHFCYTHLDIGIPIPLCEVYSHERGRFCCAALAFCMSGSGASVNGAPPSKFIKLMLYRAHANPLYFPNRNPVLRRVDGAAGTLSRVVELSCPGADSGSPEWRVQLIHICAKAFE